MHSDIRPWKKATFGPFLKLTDFLMVLQSLQHDSDDKIRVMQVLEEIKKRISFLFLVDQNTCEMHDDFRYMKFVYFSYSP